MMSVFGYFASGIRIPNNNISIGTNTNVTFLWVEIENFSSICTGDGNKTARIQNASMYTIFPYNRHAILNTVYAIGNIGKIAHTQLLVFLVKSAIVTAGGLQIITKIDRNGEFRSLPWIEMLA